MSNKDFTKIADISFINEDNSIPAEFTENFEGGAKTNMVSKQAPFPLIIEKD